MKPPLVLKAGNDLVPFDDVEHVDIRALEDRLVVIHTKSGRLYTASDNDAVEVLMALKPTAMEGRRLRWERHSWAFHNMVGHPVTQVLAWLGFRHAAIRFHDYTAPRPIGWK